jgi:hypothetical protein
MVVGVPMDGPQILDPNDISRTQLPEKFTVLLSGNFMVLDSYLRAKGEQRGEGEMPSFIEIGFGDNRTGFAGMHRFEVSRDMKSVKEEGQEDSGEGEVKLWYSSISCNPTENKLPFPGWVFNFHEFYAQSLFRDGIAGVLRN